MNIKAYKDFGTFIQNNKNKNLAFRGFYFYVYKLVKFQKYNMVKNSYEIIIATIKNAA